MSDDLPRLVRVYITADPLASGEILEVLARLEILRTEIARIEGFRFGRPGS